MPILLALLGFLFVSPRADGEPLQAQVRPFQEARSDIVNWYISEVGPLWCRCSSLKTVGVDERGEYYLLLQPGEECSGTLYMQHGASTWHLRMMTEAAMTSGTTLLVTVRTASRPPDQQRIVYQGGLPGGDVVLELLQPPFPKDDYVVTVRYSGSGSMPHGAPPYLRWYGVYATDAFHKRMNKPKK